MFGTLLLGQVQSADPIRAGSSFFLKAFLAYFCGAFGTSFTLIWLIAAVLVGLFSATILVERLQSRVWAQVWWGTFVLLSMLVIWFDFWLVIAFRPLFSSETAEALAQETASRGLEGLLSFSLGTIVNAAWAFFWMIAARELDAELHDLAGRRQQKQALNELVSQSLTVPTPVTPAILSPIETEVHCLACQSPMSSRNRFCTRCGAPLQSPPVVNGGP